MRKLLVTMSDNITWQIPVHLVAESYARYYAERDVDTTYEFELEYILSEDGEEDLLDWAANNMNWADVSHAARSRPRPNRPVDYDREWTNADMEIVDE